LLTGFIPHHVEGTPQYFNIVDQLPFMTSSWDKKTWTQYAYFDSGGFVSFDDENAICAKVQYAQEHSLNGFIIWELSGDLSEFHFAFVCHHWSCLLIMSRLSSFLCKSSG